MTTKTKKTSKTTESSSKPNVKRDSKQAAIYSGDIPPKRAIIKGRLV